MITAANLLVVIVAVPLVTAFIGYITNWAAVKMIFQPEEFVGVRPFGVKLIGATAHYATGELDQGPIIHQDVTPVSHRHEVTDLIRLGTDLEKSVLARAVRLHLEHRVLAYGNRTVVFD